MLIRLIALIITAFVLNGCAASLSSEGAQIQTVTDKQKECCCDFITIVTASEEFGLTQGMDAGSGRT